MVLLDRVLEAADSCILTELTVRDDGLFSDRHTVPAWVGMEYMAQAVAAYSGYQRRRQGRQIELGFLLGTRLYQCSAPQFDCGSILRVGAEKVVESSNDMAVFDCFIEGEQITASAKLNVFLPRDSRQFLAGKGL